MKRWVLLFAASLCFSAVASAQAPDNPKLEAFIGYSYLHFHEPGGDLVVDGENLGPVPALDASLNGGSASLAYSPINHLALVGDFGGYASTQGGNLAGAAILTFLFGPKIEVRTGKFTPFAQFLVGGAHVTGSGGSSSFAWAAGGGVDMNLTHRFSIRLVQAEFLKTYLTDFVTNRQDNVRISAGVVARF
jgi:opacity protein-like surface antigen